MSDETIYLDHNATTPLCAEAREAVEASLRDAWGNPSSPHVYGRRAFEVVERGRARVAALLACEPDEVVFTSGGTESNNAALVGVAEALAERGRHLITSAVEHPAVAAPCAYLESRGWRVTRVPVDDAGRLDPGDVEAALLPDTVLVSLMHANNESGVLLPIADVARRLSGRDVLLHSDAAQTVGKLDVRVDDLGVDLLTLAGHKLYGPKGIGALYLRRGTPFAGFLRGAGHERGRRAGTENVPLIAGLGAACDVAAGELPEDRARLAAVRDRLLANLASRFADLRVHGADAERLPNTLLVAFPGVDAAQLLAHLDGVAAAAGAACHGAETKTSATLRAMGVPDDLARATLRFSAGRSTTFQDVDRAAERVAEAAERLPSG